MIRFTTSRRRATICFVNSCMQAIRSATAMVGQRPRRHRAGRDGGLEGLPALRLADLGVAADLHRRQRAIALVHMHRGRTVWQFPSRS